MSVDTSGLERRVQELALDRAAKLAQSFQETVRRNAPRRTGELSDSVEVDRVEPTGYGATAHVVVGAPYAVFVNDGTGIYGPEGTPIVPRHPGGVLVFDWIAAGGIVFARSVRGSEPTHFWERSLDQWPQIVSSL